MRFWHSLILFCSLCANAPSFGAEAPTSGTFSNLQVNSESGDLLGVEILVLPAGGDAGGYVALVQIAAGGAPYSVLVPLIVKGASIEFDLPKEGPYAGVHFSGMVSKTGISGTWNTGRKEILKRGISYWDRPALQQ
jgi:hypothetical protein